MPIYKYYTAQGCLAQGFTVYYKFLLLGSSGLLLRFEKELGTLMFMCISDGFSTWFKYPANNWKAGGFWKIKHGLKSLAQQIFDHLALYFWW